MAEAHCNKPSNYIDITGRRYGSWVVLGRDESRSYTRTRKTTYWLCRCDCGAEKSVRGQHLRKGITTSCGCRFTGLDLTGLRFGRLVAFSIARRSSRGVVYWSCRCDCGGSAEVSSENLRVGQTTSCGCYQRERASEANFRHGLCDSRQYHSWAGMVQRCTNRDSPAWDNYGGRGVYVCERWLNSAKNFLDDMGDPPPGDYSIDRIDNGGGYTCGKCDQCRARGWPANCRWATRVEQAYNRRTNRLITHQGESLPLGMWAERVGLRRRTVEGRIRSGWTVERALSTPVRRPKG